MMLPIVTGFLAFSVLQITYWICIRPLLLKKIRYAVFAQRDNLRLSLLRGKIGEKERSFELAERLCNVVIRSIGTISYSRVLLFRPDTRAKLQAQQDAEMIMESPYEVHYVCLQLGTLLNSACVVNSPCWWIYLATVDLAKKLWLNKPRRKQAEIETKTVSAAYDLAFA